MAVVLGHHGHVSAQLGGLSLDTRVPELDPTAGEWGPGTSYSSAFSTAGKGGMLTRW